MITNWKRKKINSLIVNDRNLNQSHMGVFGHHFITLLPGSHWFKVVVFVRVLSVSQKICLKIIWIG